MESLYYGKLKIVFILLLTFVAYRPLTVFLFLLIPFLMFLFIQ